MIYKSVSPSTGKTIKQFEKLSDNSLEQKLELANDCHHLWGNASNSKKKEFLTLLSKNLLTNKSNFAQLITQEMGKPITQAIQEIEKCALMCDYYADHFENFLAPKQTSKENGNYYQLCPSGIIFAIMPWNFPFWQVFRACIPNLVLGNGFLLSHAPNVLGSAEAIEKIMIESGLPTGVMQSLVLDHDQAEKIIKHPYITGVTFTGSRQTGIHIATLAGQALKKVVLELGGNDPYLILDDADLDFAAKTLVDGRFMNAGQVCISPKRIIATENIFESFQNKVLNLVNAYRTGDPNDRNCLMGPMARDDLREKLHLQVQQSIQQGAQCLVGGDYEKKDGFYYSPTFLTNVKPGMPAFDEELFGPVISMVNAKDEHEAILLANQSCYGLGSGVFSKDIIKAEKIITDHLHVGLGKINGLVRSDPRLPFGGVKGSGFGRECGTHGLQEFANIKTIII